MQMASNEWASDVISHVSIHVNIDDDVAIHPWRFFFVTGNGLGLG
jgi:hypothetical protein